MHKLFYDTLLIGEVELTNNDFPDLTGNFTMLLTSSDPISELLFNYIDFSRRQVEFYSGDELNEELEEKLSVEEMTYEDLINSTKWRMEEENGKSVKILIPTFDKDNVIGWRLSLGG